MSKSVKSPARTSLRIERAYFDEHRENLLKLGRGRFVLIKGRKVYGFFDTKFDAIDAGYEKFGNVPYFVHKVSEVDEPVVIASHLLGV